MFYLFVSFFRELIKWESKSKGKKPTSYSAVNFYSLKVQCQKHLRLVRLTGFVFPKVKFGLSDYRQRATCHNPNARIFRLPQDKSQHFAHRCTWRDNLEKMERESFSVSRLTCQWLLWLGFGFVKKSMDLADMILSKRTWLFLLGTAIGGYTDVA
jgi:hypothetical protein